MKEVRLKFDIELPADILTIKDVFKANGFKLFVVGGAVRDAVLGITPKDFDLATDANPDKVEEMMQAAKFRTLATGKAFGVINVFTESGEFEVATFRKDIGSGRRPESVEFTNIEGDVERRDLTINALFFDIDTSEIVDLVGGLEDLKNGVVRTVGPAADRFGEDRLRILRAIRFAARFGSELYPDIVEFLSKKAMTVDELGINKLEGISAERIRDEFIKGIKSAKDIQHFLKMIADFNLFDNIFPELIIPTGFALGRCESNKPILVLASLLRFNNKDLLAKQLNKLTFSTDEIKGILFLISLLDLTPQNAIDIKRKQEQSGVSVEEIISFTMRHGLIDSVIEGFLNLELTITGEQVMVEFGLKPGPEVGKKIHELETKKFIKLIS